MNEVRIGMIGIGNMGSAHAKSIFDKKINGLRLVAVCDVDSSKREWAKNHLDGVQIFEDEKAMIQADILDAVLIATPHYIHPDIAILAFAHGLHVLSEKPAGVFTRQVELMNQAALQAGTVFSMMYNQRTNPIYRKVRDMVQGGELGELKRCVWIITNWYRTQHYYDSGSWRGTWAGEGGGVLMNQCPHNLDLWQWIFGMPVKMSGFCSYGKYHDIEVEDDVTAYAEYANGATAVLITTTGEYPGTNRLEISGDKGKIIVEDQKIRYWELETPEREVCVNSKESFASIPFHYSEVKTEGVETSHNGILQNFTNAILHGEELIAPGVEGIKGLSLSNAILLSDWLGKPVELPIDDAKFAELLQEKIASSRQKDRTVTKNSEISGTYSNRWKITW
jgi:predicted dehydrogenase